MSYNFIKIWNSILSYYCSYEQFYLVFSVTLTYDGYHGFYEIRVDYFSDTGRHLNVRCGPPRSTAHCTLYTTIGLQQEAFEFCI